MSAIIIITLVSLGKFYPLLFILGHYPMNMLQLQMVITEGLLHNYRFGIAQQSIEALKSQFAHCSSPWIVCIVLVSTWLNSITLSSVILLVAHGPLSCDMCCEWLILWLFIARCWRVTKLVQLRDLPSSPFRQINVQADLTHIDLIWSDVQVPNPYETNA
jgi:hypothetical protein